MEQCPPPSVERTVNDGTVRHLTRTQTPTQNTSLKMTSLMPKITAGSKLAVNYILYMYRTMSVINFQFPQTIFTCNVIVGTPPVGLKVRFASQLTHRPCGRFVTFLAVQVTDISYILYVFNAHVCSPCSCNCLQFLDLRKKPHAATQKKTTCSNTLSLIDSKPRSNY